MELKTVYFDNTGSENTEEALHIAKQRADELGIKKVLLASTEGDTAVKAMDILKGKTVIVVSHQFGFRDPNKQRITEENKKIIESKGGIILYATHGFAGLSRAMRSKLETASIGDIIADTLRIFSAGTKVACEISIMAADAGLVRTDEDVVAIAGTSRGSDTAVVLKPVNSNNFFDLRVREILCKPRF